MTLPHPTDLHEYLFDVAKIVEGATSQDHAKMRAYIEHLSQKLEMNGEAEAAHRMRSLLAHAAPRQLGAANLSRLAGRGAPPRQLPVDSESGLPVADEEQIPRGSVSAFLPADAEATVRRFLDYRRHADQLFAQGVGVSASMLMFGPPGTGKTQLARYIAAELQLPLLTARADGLISSYLGSTAKNVRLLFEHATTRPCVLFLDEFDSIAKMRDDAKELGELKRVVISLLQNIDAMGRDHVLLAATNHEHLLDPAIWRRFAYKVRLGPPDLPARTEMLRAFLGRFADETTVALLADLSAGMTGAQLRHAAEDAIRAAVLEGRPTVSAREAAGPMLAGTPGAPLRGDEPVAEQLMKLRDRDRKVFTQARLADLFGMSQSAVSKALKGRSKS